MTPDAGRRLSFVDALGDREQARVLVRSMPSMRCRPTLKTEMQLNESNVRGGPRTMFSHGCPRWLAVPYCDVSVTENHCHDVLIRQVPQADTDGDPGGPCCRWSADQERSGAL